jgi:HTH-type transcriptional regulator / antitoxin HipB
MRIRSATELGHLSRERRTQRGLTQAQLAQLVGVSRKWIIDLEAGKRTADLSLVLRTLNVLGLELDVRDRPESSALAAVVDHPRRSP